MPFIHLRPKPFTYDQLLTWKLYLFQEVKAKKPRIEGEANAREIDEHTKKKKKSKKHIGKENEAKSPELKSVKKKKKKQKPSSSDWDRCTIVDLNRDPDMCSHFRNFQTDASVGGDDVSRGRAGSVFA